MSNELALAVIFSKSLDSDEIHPSADETVARAKAGDTDAFAVLFHRHHRQVLRTAARLLGNAEDAGDAAQEVFLRLHKYLHRFDDERAFAPWLYQITVNVCREIGRKRGNLLSLDRERENGTFREVPDTRDIEHEAGIAQEKRILAEALATLSEKERAAIVLRDLEGLDTREVARLLGSSETTVRSQISMARVKLKRYRD